ncbi:MAG: hypothetical protein ACTSPQ_19810 [Candidatus Helarchaeota archaeon]
MKRLNSNELKIISGGELFGISYDCLGVLIAAGGFIAAGPGAILLDFLGAAGYSLGIVCACDKELDGILGTNFQEECC